MAFVIEKIHVFGVQVSFNLLYI